MNYQTDDQTRVMTGSPSAPRPASGTGGNRPDKRRRRSAISRRRIIDAAIDLIALRGLAKTTLQTLSEATGLSPTLVIFHFKTKERLYIEVLKQMGAVYFEGWRAAAGAPGASAAERLMRMLEYDLAFAAERPKFLSVWYAFWGEAKGGALYKAIGLWHDKMCLRDIEAAVREIVAEGGYRGVDPAAAANALYTMIFGHWLNAHLEPESYRYDAAMRSFRCVLAALFPNHFAAEGGEAAS